MDTKEPHPVAPSNFSFCLFKQFLWNKKERDAIGVGYIQSLKDWVFFFLLLLQHQGSIYKMEDIERASVTYETRVARPSVCADWRQWDPRSMISLSILVLLSRGGELYRMKNEGFSCVYFGVSDRSQGRHDINSMSTWDLKKENIFHARLSRIFMCVCSESQRPGSSNWNSYGLD